MTRLVALVALVLGACAGTPRVTDALGHWRVGRRAEAIADARGEVERFRAGNHIAQADIDARLTEVERVLADETPILLPDQDPPRAPDDPLHPGPSLDSGLRQDLAAPGATRTLRAIRVVQKLGMARFATDLFVIVWRREPWQPDGPLLAADTTAMRSVAVKVAALRALESFR